MLKAKKYDWKDSNLALFGSDTEKRVKKESAATEPAWAGAGEEVGLKIWRIVKFKVTEWPKEDYGEFFSGDSYIILNTYKDEDSDALLYDVHFWIGSYSTQDEYGTAAYKTVELDTLLDDKPIQHREVMGHESDLFKSYFPSITLLEGGADTGFRRVQPENYQPRLLHFSGSRRRVTVKEVPLVKGNITQDDVFILDLGLVIYQYNGVNANKDEKFKAVQYLQTLKSERGGKPKVESLDGADTPSSHDFFSRLQDGDPEIVEDTEEGPVTLLKVSDEDGSLDREVVKVGGVTMDDLQSKDVFIVDLAKSLFVWVGSGASIDEKRNAMAYAHSYLMTTKHPLVPVEIVPDNDVGNKRLLKALAA